MQKTGTFRACAFAAVASILGAAGAAPGAVIGYWDFNDGDLARSQGTQGSLALSLASFSVGTYTNFPAAGTTVNAEPSVPAGRALQFFNLLTIAEDGALTISNLNFSGMTGVSLSFAAERSGTEGLYQAFSVETNDGGGWVPFSSFSEPTNSYSLRSLDLSSALDGIADASIRIRFVEIVNAVDQVRFDNLKISAVPEPGIGALLVAGTGLLFARRRRDHRTQGQ